MSGEAVTCGYRNWVSSLQFAMSERDYRGHRTASKFRHGANSSRDPGVSSTRSSSRVSSNARSHPKADVYTTHHSSHHNSHYDNHHQERSIDDRKRKSDGSSCEDIWTEHMSSKGRVYYYNQRTEKSQWTKPTRGTIKRLKEEDSLDCANTSESSHDADPIKRHDRESSGLDSIKKRDRELPRLDPIESHGKESSGLDPIKRHNRESSDLDSIKKTDRESCGLDPIKRHDRESCGLDSIKRRDRESSGLDSIKRHDRESCGLDSAKRRDRESSGLDSIKRRDRESSGSDSVMRHDRDLSHVDPPRRDICLANDVDIIGRRSELAVTKQLSSRNPSRSTSACSTPVRMSPVVTNPQQRSSSSSVTPDIASPTVKQLRCLDGEVKFQGLPPEAHDLHPLQQALLLQQSSMILPTHKEPEASADGHGGVSMEMSSPSPPSSSSEPVNCPKLLLPSISSSLCGDVPSRKDATHTDTAQNISGEHMSRPLDPLLPQSTEQEQLRSADSSLGIEKDSEQTLEVHTTSLHVVVDCDKKNPLLSPTFSYNPIADLPVHLREPLPLPAIDADNFQPNLTEFWYTPANEMMEKQIHQSANEFMFKTVSMTRRLDSHLAKSSVTLQTMSLLSSIQTSRLQTLKKVVKDIEDTR